MLLFQIDAQTPRYFMKTFASTNIAGDAATLRFNGSAVWAYGSKRANHVGLSKTYIPVVC